MWQLGFEIFLLCLFPLEDKLPGETVFVADKESYFKVYCFAYAPFSLGSPPGVIPGAARDPISRPTPSSEALPYHSGLFSYFSLALPSFFSFIIYIALDWVVSPSKRNKEKKTIITSTVSQRHIFLSYSRCPQLFPTLLGLHSQLPSSSLSFFFNTPNFYLGPHQTQHTLSDSLFDQFGL